jgi:hypothetical protein
MRRIEYAACCSGCDGAYTAVYMRDCRLPSLPNIGSRLPCRPIFSCTVQSENSRSCCVAPASHEAPPALPEMSPSPIVPFLTSVPSGHVPSAVVAKVCVNSTATPTVLPPIVWMDVTCVTVGACVGASAATGPPPPAAAWAEAREKRGRSRRRAVTCIIASEAPDEGR